MSLEFIYTLAAQLFHRCRRVNERKFQERHEHVVERRRGNTNANNGRGDEIFRVKGEACLLSFSPPFILPRINQINQLVSWNR